MMSLEKILGGKSLEVPEVLFRRAFFSLLRRWNSSYLLELFV